MTSGAFLFIGLVFAAVFLLAVGLVVPAFGEGGRARRLMKARLKQIDAESEQGEVASLLRAKYLRELPPLARQLEQMPAMEDLALVIEQSGHTILAHRFVLLAAILAAVGLVTGWLLTRTLLFGLAGAIIGGAIPFLKIQRDRMQRFARFDEQLPDAMDVMKRALRAGHPFNACVKLVADDMPEPIAGEFRETFADINYGSDLRRALLGLLRRMPSITLMGVVTAVLVQRETGGNLAEIFERISMVVRGRFRFQRKVRTLSAEGRLSAWILMLVPVVLFAVVWVTSPTYLPVLLENETGRKMLVFCGIMAVLGVLWMRKIIRIEV
jgi:tight adherence protein B